MKARNGGGDMKKYLKKTSILSAFVFLFTFFALSVAKAQTSEAELKITVIHAKSGEPYLSPELRPLWRTIRKTFGDQFSSYRQITSKAGVVQEGKQVTVDLPDGTTFEAMYNGVTKKAGLLRVHLAFGEFRTKVRIHSGGTFFQAGRKYDKGTLIIAVSATLKD